MSIGFVFRHALWPSAKYVSGCKQIATANSFAQRLGIRFAMTRIFTALLYLHMKMIIMPYRLATVKSYFAAA